MRIVFGRCKPFAEILTHASVHETSSSESTVFVLPDSVGESSHEDKLKINKAGIKRDNRIIDFLINIFSPSCFAVRKNYQKEK